jgi:hypothetical protein
MANEVALFNSNTEVDLSYLKGIDDPLTKQLAGNSGGKRISIRGGVFRMMVSGQEVAKSPDRHLNIVVVDASPSVSRTYYKGTYQEGVTVPPACWSDDGVKPDTTVPAPMGKTCNDCPMNVKGSGQGESKACRYSQRLAVALANNLDGDVYNLTVAATSIFGKGDDSHMPLQQYTKKLAGHGLPIRAVVTKAQFDLDSATPKLVFSAERPLSQAEYQTVISQSETEDSRYAIAAPSYTQVISKANTPVVEAPKPATPAPAPVAEEVAEPTVREKPAAAKPAEAKQDIDQLLADWDDD